MQIQTHTALVRCIHRIRVTSHEDLNVSNHRRLDCLFNSLSTRPDLHATIPDLHATIPDLHATRPDLRATNRTNGECTSRPNNDEGTLWSEPAYCNSIFELLNLVHRVWHKMTPSNGNIFRIKVPFCGEFAGHRWIPLIKASDAELWCFL